MAGSAVARRGGARTASRASRPPEVRSAPGNEEPDQRRPRARGAVVSCAAVAARLLAPAAADSSRVASGLGAPRARGRRAPLALRPASTARLDRPEVVRSGENTVC